MRRDRDGGSIGKGGVLKSGLVVIVRLRVRGREREREEREREVRLGRLTEERVCADWDE